MSLATSRVEPQLLDVTRQLFQGVKGITNSQVEECHTLISRQIAYAVQRFAADLQHHMGFSTDFALTTARQIAPKAVFYSAAMLLRISGLRELLHPQIPAFFTTQNSSYQEALQQWLYVQVAPEMTAYLFDQNIDHYNQDARESNAVQTMIDEAVSQLPEYPDYYLRKLTQFLDTATSKRFATLPEHLQAFSLLVPYVQGLQAAHVERDEIYDVLYTLADVIANEHLAQIAYAQGQYDAHRFRRYMDFVDFATGNLTLVEDSAEHTVGRAMLRSVGYLMVVSNHYLLQRFRDPSRYVGSRSLRVMISSSSELVALLRVLESSVRIGDDLGDLEIDRQVKAPNIFLSSQRVRDDLFALSGIGSGRFKLYAEHYIMEAVNARYDYRSQIMDAFIDMEQNGYRQVLEGKVPASTGNDLKALIQIIEVVIWGSKINSLYNDRSAEQIGVALSRPAQSMGKTRRAS